MVLAIPAAFAAIFFACEPRDNLRDRFLRALVCFGAAIFAITEALGAFGALRPMPLLASWIAVAACAATLAWKRKHIKPLPMPRFDWAIAVYCAACAAIFVATGTTAAFSSPNSADAMAYHMPRVLFWAEQGSVRFFPTS